MTTDDAKSYLSKREIPRLFESLMTGLMYHRPSDHIQYLIDCLHKVHDKGQENITWSSFVDIRRSKTPLPPINNNEKKRPTSKGSSRPTSRTRTPKGEEILTLDMGNLENSLVNRMISPSLSERSLTPLSERVTSPLAKENRVFSPARLDSVRKAPSETTSSISEETPKQDIRTSTPPLPAIQKDKVNIPDVPIVLVMGAPGSGKDVHVEKVVARYPGWKQYNMGSLIKEEILRRGEAHTKWKLTKDLISRGEPAPEDVIIDALIDALKGASDAKGIIIIGFPRNMTQVGHFQKQVGRVDAAFMIDCEEVSATDRLLRRGKTSNRPEDTMAAIANRLNYFKANTLEAAKFYDDQGKLIIIDGDQDEATVTYEVGKAFDDMFFTKNAGAQPVGDAPTEENVPEAPLYKSKFEKEDTEPEFDKDAPLFPGAVPQPPEIIVEDTGRKPGLPECPIIFVAGGPGSGKGTQCERIIKRYPGFVHLSMGDIIRTEISTRGTADEKWGMIATLVSKGEMAPEEETVHLLKEEMKKHSTAKAFVVEGFPRDKGQVEAFNKEIGGLNFVMLFDCEEYYMQTRLMKRGRESGRIDDNITAISNRINFYKYNTLPVMRYYENIGKLVMLDADKDMEEMFYEISKLFDFAFFGKAQEDQDIRKVGLGEDEAATRIQAGFRGYMTRSHKKLDSKQEKEEYDLQTHDEKLVEENDDELKEAAMRIQAGFRGYKARREIQAQKADQAKDKAEDEKQPDQEEVVEETIAPTEATTSGENIENPAHSQALDEAADS